MNRYRYTALNKGGQQQQGEMEAASEQALGQHLRGQGLFVLEVESLNSFDTQDALQSLQQLKQMLASLLPVTATQKIFFFRQISLMLRSGLSLTDALKTVTNLTSGRLKISVGQMLEDVQFGERFSVAISKQQGLFPEMAEHMIRSAEASGQLDEVMLRIANHMEQKADLKREIQQAMFYPIITMLLGAVIFVFLVTGIIPKFAKFFENSGKPIPPETQSLLDLSAFMIQWGPWIAGLLVIILSTIVYAYGKPTGRLIIDRILLQVPLIGSIISLGAMAQAAWSLAMLLRSGLPLVDSLTIVKQLMPNRMISGAFEQACESVLHGRDLERSLRSPYITPLMRQLAAVGEQSGSLDQVMAEAGAYYQQALTAKNKLLGKLIEPASILIIGGMVAYVYISFFKSIFAISGG